MSEERAVAKKPTSKQLAAYEGSKADMRADKAQAKRGIKEGSKADTKADIRGAIAKAKRK